MAWLTSALLLTSGVFTGAILCIARERVPAWAAMSVADYRKDFRAALRRMDPAMPILALLSAGLGIASASGQHDRRAILTWSGSTLLILVVVLSAALLEPVNSQFRREMPMIDQRVAALRNRWGLLHMTRSAASLIAYVCFIAAATT